MKSQKLQMQECIRVRNATIRLSLIHICDGDSFCRLPVIYFLFQLNCSLSLFGIFAIQIYICHHFTILLSLIHIFLLECLVEIQDKVCKELGIKGVNECLEYLEERNR